MRSICEVAVWLSTYPRKVDMGIRAILPWEDRLFPFLHLKLEYKKYSEVLEMEQEKIGRLIAAKRKEKGLTQEQLAEKLGVTNKAVSKWETGKGMPDLAIIQELSKVLGITVSTLLNGEENREEEVIIKLLKVIENLKQLYLVIIGLLICNIPQILEKEEFIEEIMNGSGFAGGMLHGVFTAIMLFGAMVFAYGIGRFIREKARNKEEFDNLKPLFSVVIGLVVCNIPQILKEENFIKEATEGSGFFNGMLNGAFAATMLVGAVIFAYGIGCFIRRKVGNKNK